MEIGEETTKSGQNLNCKYTIEWAIVYGTGCANYTGPYDMISIKQQTNL